MELNDIYYFSQLSPDELSRLRSITRTRSYARGNILFYAGETPRTLHIVAQGSVEVFKHDTAGNEIHIAFFHPAEMIAEMAHFEAIPYPATARCETDASVHEIDFEAFRAFVADTPSAAFGIIRSLTRKIKQLEGVVQRSVIDDAETRLGRFLAEHHDRLSSMTQRTIAERLMLAPETVSRILRRFKEQGWVEVRQKKLHLIDADALRVHVGERS